MLLPKFISRRIDLYKRKTKDTANFTIETVIKAIILAIISFTIIWISIFLYVAFYYTYVPSIEYVKPVNLQFKPCDKKEGICSFPKAHIELTKANQILMVGQPYRISVTLEMPESPGNKNLGMFMVCGQLMSKGGIPVAHQCRSSMLRYRSSMLHYLTTLSLAPLYILGSLEEKQSINVELIPSHEEDQNFPVTDVYIEIKSHFAEIYSSKLYINAHLTGLRYMMFHWPVLSAAFGISFNLMAIVFIVALSWCHLYGPYEQYGPEFIYERIKKSVTPERSKEGHERDENPEVSLSGGQSTEDDESNEEFITDLKKLDTSTEA